ncbi:MAG: glutamyl-tRNA reductase [Gammaproteobacteria bacterium]
MPTTPLQFRPMLFVIGVSHKTAPLAVRERLAVAPTRIPELLDQLLETDGVDEAVLLATCNRTELYAVAQPQYKHRIVEWFSTLGNFGGELAGHLYVHEGAPVARHLFRVAAGLDSMVLGENQILGQVKTAYLDAHRTATVGPELHQLFQYALGVTKGIRTDSALDSLRSLPYAAAKLARERLGGLAGRSAVLIGAGETISALAFHLRAQGIGHLLIANRTQATAVALAAQHGGQAIAFANLPVALAAADLLASATTSETPIVTADLFGERRAEHPLLVLDLAVPRDVSPDVHALPGIEVIGVDDLSAVVAASGEMRYAAAAEAEAAVEQALAAWHKTRRIRDAVPTICALRAEAARARRRTLAEARRIAAARGTDAALEYLAATLTNRLMHAPTVRLRAAAAADEAEFIATTRELFGLGEEGERQDNAAA